MCEDVCWGGGKYDIVLMVVSMFKRLSDVNKNAFDWIIRNMILERKNYDD